MEMTSLEAYILKTVFLIGLSDFLKIIINPS